MHAGAAMIEGVARLRAWWRARQALRERRPGRRLRITRAGKFLLAIALALGFAAMNTGNNLLFFGWGLLLSAIVISGVLSEATVRPLRATPGHLVEARAGQLATLPWRLVNESAFFPAFGVELCARVMPPGGSADMPPLRVAAPFLLRLSAREEIPVRMRWTPTQRGRHRLVAWDYDTAYPFGFFEKTRRHVAEGEPSLWVWPGRVDVSGLTHTLLSRLGERATRRIGAGEEFFAMRPYREGDDLRWVSWRATARTGRWTVRETEAAGGRALMLELVVPPSMLNEVSHRLGATPADACTPDVRIEHAIATLASLAEDLLAAGRQVGIRSHGIWLAPSGAPTQRAVILGALARLSPTDVPPPPRVSRAFARVAVVPPGFSRPAGVDAVVRPPGPASGAESGAARDGLEARAVSPRPEVAA